MGRGLHVMTDHETDHDGATPVLYLEKSYRLYRLYRPRGTSTSQNPWIFAVW